MNLLTSNKTDEEISGELADLVGYEELEFVTSVVQNRGSLVNQVSLLNLLRRSLIPSFRIIEGQRLGTIPLGRGKAKAKLGTVRGILLAEADF